MNLQKSEQSIRGIVLQLMNLLMSNNQASFLDKGIAVATLNHFGMILSEALLEEAGQWCSLDNEDWWVLENHPHIDAVRLDNDVWQVKERSTTFTYVQCADQYEKLTLQLEHDETNDAGMRVHRRHIVNWKLSYPDEATADYHWHLHQVIQRQVEGTAQQQVLAECEEDYAIPEHLVPYFIFNPDNPLIKPILET